MKLAEIRHLFSTGQIDKQSFIERMSENHQLLKDYSDFLNQSGIQKIEIEDTGLVFTSRATSYHNGGIRFNAEIEDKRTAPLEAFNFGRYEDEDSEMIYKLIEDDYNVFDIGANIGWYTIHIAKNLTQGKLYAFEPIPDTYSRLKRNVVLNNIENVVLNNIALSDSKGHLSFYYSPKMTVASSSQNITNNENAILINCETETLDNYFLENNIERVDFIKCDIEGAELFALKGALKTISSQLPIIFTEMLRKWSAKFGYHPNDIINLLESIGYECFINRGGNLLKVEKVDENTLETNYFFFHKINHLSKVSSFS